MDDQIEYKDLIKTAECGNYCLDAQFNFFDYLAAALLSFFSFCNYIVLAELLIEFFCKPVLSSSEVLNFWKLLCISISYNIELDTKCGAWFLREHHTI